MFMASVHWHLLHGLWLCPGHLVGWVPYLPAGPPLSPSLWIHHPPTCSSLCLSLRHTEYFVRSSTIVIYYRHKWYNFICLFVAIRIMENFDEKQKPTSISSAKTKQHNTKKISLFLFVLTKECSPTFSWKNHSNAQMKMDTCPIPRPSWGYFHTSGLTAGSNRDSNNFRVKN